MTVSTDDAVPLCEAVMVNEAEALPAGTVTDGGTVAIAELELESVTVTSA